MSQIEKWGIVLPHDPEKCRFCSPDKIPAGEPRGLEVSGASEATTPPGKADRWARRFMLMTVWAAALIDLALLLGETGVLARIARLFR
jgi:hypothetical protein